MKTVKESSIMRRRLVQKLFHYAGSLRVTLMLYIGLYFFCAIVFMIMEQSRFIDAIWFCTVTWFTVGYGDKVPVSDGSRLFTIFAIVASHILIILVTANFVTKLAHSRTYYSKREELDAYENEEETDVASIIS